MTSLTPSITLLFCCAILVSIFVVVVCFDVVPFWWIWMGIILNRPHPKEISQHKTWFMSRVRRFRLWIAQFLESKVRQHKLSKLTGTATLLLLLKVAIWILCIWPMLQKYFWCFLDMSTGEQNATCLDEKKPPKTQWCTRRANRKLTHEYQLWTLAIGVGI